MIQRQSREIDKDEWKNRFGKYLNKGLYIQAFGVEETGWIIFLWAFSETQGVRDIFENLDECVKQEMEVNFFTVRKQKSMKFPPVSIHSTDNKLSGAMCNKLFVAQIYLFQTEHQESVTCSWYNLYCAFTCFFFFLKGTKNKYFSEMDGYIQKKYQLVCSLMSDLQSCSN